MTRPLASSGKRYRILIVLQSLLYAFTTKSWNLVQ
jgi:hypothetical protein